jgi:hypothetical protein
MISSIDDHKFNDDLLLRENDRKLAAIKYPSIAHVLDYPELRQLFSQYDATANRAKRKGLIAGILAIGFGFGALAIAATEFLFSHTTRYTIALTVASGLFGICSFLIGSVGVDRPNP